MDSRVNNIMPIDLIQISPQRFTSVVNKSHYAACVLNYTFVRYKIKQRTSCLVVADNHLLRSLWVTLHHCHNDNLHVNK